VSLGQASYGYGGTWNSATNQFTTGGDWSYDLGEITRYLSRPPADERAHYQSWLQAKDKNELEKKNGYIGLGINATRRGEWDRQLDPYAGTHGFGGVLAAAWEAIWPWPTSYTRQLAGRLNINLEKPPSPGNQADISYLVAHSGHWYAMRKLVTAGYVHIDTLVIYGNRLLTGQPSTIETTYGMRSGSVTSCPIYDLRDPHTLLSVWP
jgi:hypothetical protein